MINRKFNTSTPAPSKIPNKKLLLRLLNLKFFISFVFRKNFFFQVAIHVMKQVNLAWILKKKKLLVSLFHNGGPYHIEISPLTRNANQWTSFYMKGTSVMKE